MHLRTTPLLSGRKILHLACCCIVWFNISRIVYLFIYFTIYKLFIELLDFDLNTLLSPLHCTCFPCFPFARSFFDWLQATFEAKAGGQRKKKGKKKKQQKETQEKKLLSWHEEKGEVSKKAAGVVVLKNAFDPKQFDEDATFLTDIQSDLRKFCTDFGEVKKVMVFDRHPDGVVSIKFTDVASAQKCMRVS